MSDETRKVLNDAVAALQAAKNKIKRLEAKLNEPIAIVSMACRLPGDIYTPEAFWQMLAAGKDVITEFPKDRWDANELYDANPETKGKTYCTEGGFLSEIDKFDASFFGIAPREANAMDPQQRLVLETVWEALERMGTLPANLNTSKTGVYIGALGSLDTQTDLDSLDGYAGTGKLNSVISGRVAYTLGLQGPAITIDTACSSSLVAIHLAAQALRLGECDLALAGGVTVMISPVAFIEFSRLKGLAIDGRCKSFSANADGTGWSEGCGILVLKRLSDAEKDKDNILAIIKGTAVNQDGRSQGLTAPNGPSQQRVIEKALALSNLKPADIDAIEAHGTGTTLGDPIEATSLAELFSSSRPTDKPLYLGSSKSNLGHAQAAAGVTGVIKMVLALNHQLLPKTLHAEVPSPHINWHDSGLALLNSAKDWQINNRPRRCGVSSFGISGTNAHIILEEAPNNAINNIAQADHKANNLTGNLLLLSGQTNDALKAQADQFAKFIAANSEINLADICHSTALYRTHFAHRLTLQFNNREQLIDQLKAYADNGDLSSVEPAFIEDGIANAKPAKIAFLFTGQGAQYAGMTKELYQEHALFRSALDQCASIIDPLIATSFDVAINGSVTKSINNSILKLIFAEKNSVEAELLNQTQYTQPALFAIEYALYQLWSSSGIKPTALLGHSIGELVAATCAGVFSLADGLNLAVTRGKLMAAMQPGSMLSVEVDEAQAQLLINKYDNKLSIAGLNAPAQTVISGESNAIKALIEQLKAQAIKYKELVVSHAFHSQMMDAAAVEFEKVVSTITKQHPNIAIVSNLTGKLESELFTQASYWSKQLRQAVRFTDGLKALITSGITTFIELGPQPVLSGLGTQINSSNIDLNFFSSLKKNQSDKIVLSKAIANLWLQGIELDWAQLTPGKFVQIPTYPFQRERYWQEVNIQSAINRSINPISGQRLDLPDGEIVHIVELNPRVQTDLADHIIHGQIVLAGAYHLSILTAIAQTYWPDQAIEINDFRILRALIFDSVDEIVKLHISLQPAEHGFSVSVSSFRKEEWAKYIEANISVCRDLADNLIADLDINNNLEESSLSLQQLDEVLKAVTIEWRTAWWAIDQAIETSTGILSRYRLPETPKVTPFDPVALDNAFGSMFWLLAESGRELISKGAPILPIAVDKLIWYGHSGNIHWSEHQLTQQFKSDSETTESQLCCWNENGQPLMLITGFRTRRAPAQQFLSKTESSTLYTQEWQALDLNLINDQQQVNLALISRELNANANIKELLSQHIKEISYYQDLQMLSQTFDSGIAVPALIIAEFININKADQQLATNAINETQQLLNLIQSWLKDQRFISTKLTIITSHTILIGDNKSEIALTHTPIAGLISSIQNEYPNRNIQLLDIDEINNWPLINTALNSEYKYLALRKHQIFYPSLKAVKSIPANTEKGKPDLNNGTVLITGGLGSLGREVAKYLAKELSAKNLLLISRQGMVTTGADQLIKELAEYGADAKIAACDIANYDALKDLIESIPADKRLCGIIHCAGIIDDGLVLQQTADRLANVMASKVIGAWNLHLLTQNKQLAIFSFFSSLAATLGNPGQSNYAAANKFLDGLAIYRQQHGLTAQSLAWTAWAEVGMAARLSENARQQLKAQGINALNTNEALKLFAEALNRPEPFLIPAQLNIEKTKKVIKPASKDSKAKDFSPLKLQLQELDIAQREQVIVEILSQELASVLGHTNKENGKEKIDANRPFMEMGLDSLMAVEFKERISKKTALNLPATLAFDYPTLKQVAVLISEKLGYDKIVATTKTKSITKSKQNTNEPIAIISVACRFPGGVEDLTSFWQLLLEGRDAITEVPVERWNIAKYFNSDPEIKGKTYAKWGGYLGDVRQFDAGFFGISPREAVFIDPQQRLLLETSWEVLENAGIVPEQFMDSKVGIYVGICGLEYLTKVFDDPDQIDAYSLLGTQHSATVGRLSYILGLKGPNMAIDTACSSSLVALHLAVQALRNNECDGALVGGVNLNIDPRGHIYFSKLKALSPRGKCHTFSADADGYVRGEGCAMVYLKRLSDAQRDNDNIIAVIKGSAVNQDGRSNGLTAPNGPSQQEVIKAALNQANISANSVSYVECHGTGTPLGDPIEVQSLAAVYGEDREHNNPVYIGSVKTNIGHTEGAAGIASVIKAALCLQKQKLVKSLNFTAPNPHIAWSEIPVQVITSEMDWLANGTPRRIGVSSFGFSGTNAHAILEEAPEAQVKDQKDSKDQKTNRDLNANINLLLLSARTAESLKTQALKYAEHINRHSEQALTDIIYSAANYRTHFDHRLAVAFQNREQLITSLNQIATTGLAPLATIATAIKDSKKVFIYPGQGSQWLGMGKELFHASQAFRTAIEQCDQLIKLEAGFSVIDELMADKEQSRLSETYIVQPVLFAMAVALTALWQEHGVKPDMVVGHSQGEIAAAYIAGILNLTDAVKIVCRRSRIVKQFTKQGLMAMVELSVAQIQDRINRPDYQDKISIAVSNSASQTIVAGESQAIEQLLSELTTEQIFCKKILVDYAAHSPQLEIIKDEIIDALSDIKPYASQVKFISTVMMAEMQGTELDAQYWYKNLRQTVYFSQVIEQLFRSENCLMVEISSHPLLTVAMEEVRKSVNGKGGIVGTLKREQLQLESFHTSLGAAYCYGADINWRDLLSGKFVNIPTYAFDRQRFWLENSRTEKTDVSAAGLQSLSHPLLSAMTELADESGYTFSGQLSIAEQSWLAQHLVFDTIIVPGAALLELIWTAAQQVEVNTISELIIISPLVLTEKATRQIQIKISARNEHGQHNFALYSRDAEDNINGKWIKHTEGLLSSEISASTTMATVTNWPPPDSELLSLSDFYENIKTSLDVEYGPLFQAVKEVWRKDNSLFTKLVLPAENTINTGQYSIHPVLLDAALHSGFLLYDASEQSLHLPFEWRGAKLFSVGDNELYARITRSANDLEILLYDNAFEPVGQIERLIKRKATRQQLKAAALGEIERYLYNIKWQSINLTLNDNQLVSTMMLGSMSGSGQLAQQLNVDAFDNLDALIAFINSEPVVPQTIIIDATFAEDKDNNNFSDRAINNIVKALEQIQILLTNQQLLNSHLIWITKGAIDDQIKDLTHAPLWGLIRTARNEYPHRSIRLIDIDDQLDKQSLINALNIVTEPELAIRANTIFAPRLLPVDQAKENITIPENSSSWSITIAEQGTIAGLTCKKSDADIRPLSEHQVRISVQALGINFLDVVSTLAMVDVIDRPLLAEGSGIVTEIGSSVTEFNIGDRVMGLFSSNGGNIVIADSNLIIKIPTTLQFTEAATITGAFLTAYYALKDLAALKAGEKILIHAATGATGMAAVQLAMHWGAEVFVTASESKWHVLREQAFELSHIASSRDLKFEQLFLKQTSNSGMDVVLNSLAKEYIDASLKLLPNGGRFLEMGKTDIRDANEIANKYQGVKYQALDLINAGSQRIKEILQELVMLFESGKLTALPYTAYDLREVKIAFRQMAQAKHIGKLVLVPPQPFNFNGTILITGGTGELGSLVAKHLVKNYGIKHLLLTSRKGMAATGAIVLKRELEQQGVNVTIAACDVADYQSTKLLIESISEAHPLIGVIHCAGALDDAVIMEQHENKLKNVFASKAAGAWHLHQLTKEKNLNLFVMFSSVAGIFGSAGQSNYAAANTFLDALASYRRNQGLPAQSLAWGLWQQQGLGMTSHIGSSELMRMRRQGLEVITQQEGLTLFDRSILYTTGLTEPLLVATNLKLNVLSKQPVIPALFSSLIKTKILKTTNRSAIAKSALSIKDSLRSLSQDEQFVKILSIITSEIAHILALPDSNQLSPATPFQEMGFDSLMAIEARNRLSTILGLEIPASTLLLFPTAHSLTSELLRLLQLDNVNDETHVSSNDELMTAISRVARDQQLPLSFSQQRIWFAYQLEANSATYNVPITIKIDGKLQIDALTKSLKEIVDRHEILRTTYMMVDGIATQIIQPIDDLVIEKIDLQNLDQDKRETETQRLITQSAATVFDLATLPLMKIQLLQLATEEYLLLLTIHHIAIDGFSMDLLFRELGKLYQAFSENRPSPLPALEIQYADFAYWQRNWFTDERLNEKLAYWNQQLNGLKILQLPTDRPRPAIISGRSETIHFNLSQELGSKLKRLAQKQNVTLYTLMLAAFNVLLHRYTGQEDIAVGSATANREQRGIESLLGCFINILILRSDLSGNPRFTELLQRVREVTVGAFAHQDLPFEKVVEKLNFDRSKNILPHKQVAFNYQRIVSAIDIQVADITMEMALANTNMAVPELFIRITESEEKLYGMLEYSIDLFNEDTIHTMLGNYITVLNAVVDHPEQRINAIQLFHNDIANIVGIDATSIEQVSSLTQTQRDLYLAHLIDPDNTIFSDGIAIKIGKDLDVTLWQKAINIVTASEEMLQTQFTLLKDEPVQFISKVAQDQFEFIDLSNKKDAINVKEFITKLVKHQYDLKQGFPYKHYVIKDTQGEYIALLAWFHILFDAYSVKLLFEKIDTVYRLLLNGQIPVVAESGSFYQYTQDVLSQFDTKEIKEFWIEQLKSIEPLSAVTKVNKAPESRRIKINLGGEKLTQISSYCKSVNCSLSVYFRALYSLVLEKWFSPGDNFLLYEVIAVRPPGHLKTIGCIYQVVPLIFNIDSFSDDTKIGYYLKNVKEYKKRIGTKQNLSVFMQKQLIEDGLKFYFNYYNFSTINLLNNNCIMEHHKSFPESEVQFIVDDLDQNLDLILYYDENIFSGEKLIERMLHLSDQIVDGINNLGDLSILLPQEDSWLNDKLNMDQQSYVNKTVIKLFEEQVTLRPEAIAITFEDTQLTYQELNIRANQLAHYLIELNVGPEVLVGICVERSLEMMIGLLAILKAGGAYVPIDPTYPSDRQAFIVDDAKLNILLTQEKLIDKLPVNTAQMICLDRDWTEISQQNSENIDKVAQPADLAYIIYTSGSTGNPKGVMVTHFNVARLMLATEEWYKFNEKDVWTLFHSYAFDFSVWEIWGALCYGGKLVIVPYLTSRNPEVFYQLLIQEKVTVLNQTPLAFRRLMKVDEVSNEREELNLRYVIFGGEALELNSLKPWFDRHSDQQPQLINMYGITETTVHVTYRPLAKEDTKLGSVIGQPIPDLQLFIFDKDQKPVPVGVIGEIYVGGSGVARGYLNREELTATRFINYRLNNSDTTIRLYRTGDLAKYLANGDIEYIGRNDNQVKIRGFRIELGEIEAALNEHADIAESVVMVSSDQTNEKTLVAYIVMGPNRKANIATIKESLKERLPEYMVPSLIINIDKLPMTANGKVDHKALNSLALKQSANTLTASYVAPRNATEETLADIYANLLGIDRVGITDNFFDLGGHSLLVTRLMANIDKRLGVKLPLSALIQSATIERLSGLLRKEENISEWSSLVEIQKGSTQKPLFIVHPAGGNILSYYELALQLGKDQPLYGFQSHGLNKEETPHQTIEEMAAHYINLMKQIQPQGPYQLAGHSMGGVVAFEMAQQLSANGEELSLLAIFDSWISAIDGESNKEIVVKDKVIDSSNTMTKAILVASALSPDNNRLKELAAKMEQLTPDAQLEYLVHEMSELPPDIDPSQKELLLKIFKINSNAMYNYQPKVYNGKIFFFRASEGILSEMLDLASLWQKLSTQSIELYHVPGDHQSMLKSPHLETLVKHLKPFIDSTNRATAILV